MRATVATAIATTLASVELLLPVTRAQAVPARSSPDCSALFHALNVSGSGRLSSTEAASSREYARTLKDTQLWTKGYLTQQQFIVLCTGRNTRPAK